MTVRTGNDLNGCSAGETCQKPYDMFGNQEGKVIFAKIKYQAMNNYSERETSFQSPAIQTIEITLEGILCESGEDGTEGLGENIGSWG